MVPVLDKNKKPIMPCSEKRARKLMGGGQARPYWKQGIFCIILQREPIERNRQDIVIGIDPGSKRTGITVVTQKSVVINILMDTPSWVKEHVETRRMLRRNRRGRKTPYRKCRFNRKIGGIPPSTKARWGAHLRTIRILQSIMPITEVAIEDIKAKTLKGARRWNKNFSPLEVGKLWFAAEVGVKLYTFEGFDTKAHRDFRGFKKTKDKLSDKWEAHNVDSHSLCEMIIGGVEPFKGMLKCELLQWHRRQLHVQNYCTGGVRKQYGGTVSLGIKRGTLIKHQKYGRCYVGGTSKCRLSLHGVDGKRLTQNAKKEDLKILSKLIWRPTFLPSLKAEVSSRK